MIVGGTISPEYLKEQTELHKNPNYGVASLEFAPLIAEFLKNSGIRRISDYGAGKKNLLVGLNKIGNLVGEYFPYDPVFPEYGPPRPAELVCCIDVFEHIEPDRLENVLKDLASIVIKFGFFSIHLGPAGKTLSDGRNAHIIQKPISWLLPKLSNYFEVVQLSKHTNGGKGFWVLVEPKIPADA